MEDSGNHCSSECYHLKALEDLLNEKETKLEELRGQLTDVQEKCEVYKRECEQLTSELQAQKIDLRDRMRLTRDAQNQTNEASKSQTNPVVEAHTQTFETDFTLVDSASSALDWQPTGGLTIADMVKEAAETAQKSDYVYDEKSKMYYSTSTGYYYDPVKLLFYEPYQRIYYSYDEKTKVYNFHSQLNEDGTTTTIKQEGKSKKHKKSSRSKSKKHRRKRDDSSNDDSSPRRYNRRRRRNRRKSNSSRDSLEDGELNSSGDSIVFVDAKENGRQKVELVDLDENSVDTDSLPPSMRLIVKCAETLREGSLLTIISSCNGGTVGRNQSYEVCIPEDSVSRLHARIDYDQWSKNYVVTDLGSSNGSFINDTRLSEPRNTSDPCAVKHGDTLGFGNSVFAVHIHAGQNTCPECEPGLLLAAVEAKAAAFDDDQPIIIMSKEEKEQARKDQMRLMKKKYGLQSVDFEKVGDITVIGYTDRAKHRRVTKGSDNPYEKDGEGTSLEKPLTEDNKGFKMLSSMGWKKGKKLGQSERGLLEPINPNFQHDRKGLGLGKVWVE